MLIDPGITKKYRIILQSLSNEFVSNFSSYESLVRSKNPQFDAVSLRCDSRIYNLGPWIMDFSALGIRTRFDDYRKPWIESFVNLIRATLRKGPVGTLGSHMNQYARDRVIFPNLDKIFKEILRDRKKLRFLDLFCSEGFYTYYVATKFDNVRLAVGVELDSRRLVKANAINEIFHLTDKVEFQNKNVFDIDEQEQYDVSLCMGGLYHVDKPDDLIDLLSNVTTAALIVHTLIAWDENIGDDFFVSPAPGWKHGSRFSFKFIKKQITKNGWHVVDEGTNIYPATFNHKWNSKFAWFLCLR